MVSLTTEINKTTIVLALFLFVLAGCVSTTDMNTGLILGGARAVTADDAELAKIDPHEKLSKECELEQRTYLFVSNIPVMSTWISFNSYWISYMYEHYPKLVPDAGKDLSPCVRDPYVRTLQNIRTPATLKEKEGK